MIMISYRTRLTSILAGAISAFFIVTASAEKPSFFVFDNGVGRGKWTPEQQATTLKELGYEAISYNFTNPEDLANWQRECGKQGIKIAAIYLNTSVDGPRPFDPRFKEAVKLLKGSDTVIWMTVLKPKTPGDHDAAAVKNVQEIADLAAEQGLRVALYGHVDNFVETGMDSARIVKLANRPNVGATINLCHEFLSKKGEQIDETLKAVASGCLLVSINGVDLANKNYITRLDQGDYDLVSYLEKLQAAGYRGPIGLQCFNVPGDTRDNLAANIASWRSILGQMEERSATAPPQNTLTPEEVAAGWKLLFDGKTTEGWHGFQKTDFPSQGWVVDHGCLKCLGKKGGDILTHAKFLNYEFTWEWRLSFRGNSGVKYYVDENRTNVRGAIGHEYQTIDDKFFIAEPLNEKKITGAWYDVFPPVNAGANPVGEFNQSRLVVSGNKVEHWLNGKQVLAYEIDSPATTAAIANSKFKDVPDYAKKFASPLLLQDHDSIVWYRNLKLRELPAE